MALTDRRAELIEDHALERVPDAARQDWLAISWNTVGIVTTLASLFVGALVSYIAGLWLGMAAGLTVAVLGGALGWAVGHVAYASGLSSTVMSRYYGFGIKGSMIGSAIFGFMMIGIIGVENILLYKGFLFYFGAPDTLSNQILAYGAMTALWIGLTANGFRAVTAVSSSMVIGFLAVLAYMMTVIIAQSGREWTELLSFGSQFETETLRELKALNPAGKFFACINLLMGSAGALALVDADLGRYARRSRDIAIAAFAGNFFLDIVMILLGGIIVFAGMPAIIDYYVSVAGLSPDEAARTALESPDAIAAAFIVFGGVIGAFLMVVAQVKAQVLNTYSGTLALTNLADVGFNWRPGRLYFVVLANVLSLLFLYRELLDWYIDFRVSLGVLTTCMASIMLSAYCVVHFTRGDQVHMAREPDTIDWAGIATMLLAFITARLLLVDLFPVEALTAFVTAFVLYPIFRLYLLKPV